jgi:peroxiredoxin
MTTNPLPGGYKHMATVNVGDTAPDFALPATAQQQISLSQYRGEKNVLLAFYPLDWSPG